MSYERCQYDECAQAAQFMPKICVPAKSWPQEERYSITAVMGLKLCLQHALEFSSKEQFADERTAKHWKTTFEMIRKTKPGAMPLDYERAFTVAAPIDSKECQVLLKAKK